MKLLAKTNRYYLLLAVALFALGGVVLYFSLNWALRNEMDEQLLDQQRILIRARTTPRTSALLGDSLRVSRKPVPEGLHDAVRYDEEEQTMVPYRELSFPVQRAGTRYWVTLRKSQLETEDLLLVVLSVMLAVLGGLFGSLLVLNRWLARWLWAPFQRTLAELRAYDLHRRGPLALPATPIDEFTELNQALTQMSARLAADYQRLKDFTENAAHEIQTPLAIMQAQLEQLVQDDTLRPASAAIVGELYGATRRLARLHQTLTLRSSIENQQFALAVPVRLDQVVAEKAAQLEELAAARGLTLRVVVTGIPVVTMHPGLADSLVANLLQNALKHSLGGGVIEVTLIAEALVVANAGPVIEGDPARFFERFRKHHAASASTGLGLSIVQQICQYYGFGLSYTFGPAGAIHTLRVDFFQLANHNTISMLALHKNHRFGQ
jgi:signal transduction histidine kinase